jgi:ATP-dependent DNA helicase RecG
MQMIGGIKLTKLDELDELLKQREDITIDFKKSDILSKKEKLARLMVAFANTIGGKIIIGVDDKKKIEGMSEKTGHEEYIMNIARDKIDPPISPEFETINIGGSSVYVITVQRFAELPLLSKQREGKYTSSESDQLLGNRAR